MSLREKYKNWKKENEQSYKNVTISSRQETHKASLPFKNAYYDDEKLNSTFSYEFKSKSQKKALIISKKIYSILLIVFTSFLILTCIFFGLMHLPILFDPSTIAQEDIEKINNQQWLIQFLPSIILAACAILYLIPKIIIKSIRDKKFNSNPNYSLYFSDSVVSFIILSIILLFIFISFQPLAFVPTHLLLFLKFNSNPSVNFIIIASCIISSLSFATYILFIANTILCYCLNPKFKLNSIVDISK